MAVVWWPYCAADGVPRETSAADKAVADAGLGLDQVGLLGMLPPSFLLKHQLPIKR